MCIWQNLGLSQGAGELVYAGTQLVPTAIETTGVARSGNALAQANQDARATYGAGNGGEAVTAEEPTNLLAVAVEAGSAGEGATATAANAKNKSLLDTLNDGDFPGKILETKKKQKEYKETGSPREMPETGNPNESALKFAKEVIGDKKIISEKKVKQGWRVELEDGTYVTYRPSGSSGNLTKHTTATVEINSEYIKEINNDKPLKLKFPETGKTGVN